MKKISIGLVIALLVITGCQNKHKDKLEGIWQLKTLEVNGTTLQGNSLGNWKWEFNEEGGYLTDVAGAREKGLYTLKADTLKLKSVTYKDRPEQSLIIVQLDTVQMDLVSADANNRSSLHFLRLKESELGEKD